MHRMEVAVNSHLKHPLILGTDWPAFTQLLGIVCADASWQTGRGQEEAAARTGEALAGPVPACLGGNECQRGHENPRSWTTFLWSSRGMRRSKRVRPGPLIDGQLLRRTLPLLLVNLQALPSEEADPALALLCHVRALRIYVNRTRSVRSSEQLFVCHGGQQKGKAVSKQRLAHWIVEAVALAYQSQGEPCPLGVRFFFQFTASFFPCIG